MWFDYGHFEFFIYSYRKINGRIRGRQQPTGVLLSLRLKFCDYSILFHNYLWKQVKNIYRNNYNFMYQSYYNFS